MVIPIIMKINLGIPNLIEGAGAAALWYLTRSCRTRRRACPYVKWMLALCLSLSIVCLADDDPGMLGDNAFGYEDDEPRGFLSDVTEQDEVSGSVAAACVIAAVLVPVITKKEK